MHSKQRIFMYDFSLWFHFCSLEHFDLSQAIIDQSCGEGTLGGWVRQHCYIVQGNDSLEVNSETHLDDNASSSSDDYVDADALNEELSIVCEKLLEKYQVLKKKALN